MMVQLTAVMAAGHQPFVTEQRIRWDMMKVIAHVRCRLVVRGDEHQHTAVGAPCAAAHVTYAVPPPPTPAVPPVQSQSNRPTTLSLPQLGGWRTARLISVDPSNSTWSSDATGMPTMFERPMTTASFPRTSTPERWSSSTQPAGVHGIASGGSPP